MSPVQRWDLANKHVTFQNDGLGWTERSCVAGVHVVSVHTNTVSAVRGFSISVSVMASSVLVAGLELSEGSVLMAGLDAQDDEPVGAASGLLVQ